MEAFVKVWYDIGHISSPYVHYFKLLTSLHHKGSVDYKLTSIMKGLLHQKREIAQIKKESTASKRDAELRGVCMLTKHENSYSFSM